jgi:hypothetical protein
LGCLSLPRVHPRGPVGAYRPTSFPCWNFDPSPIGPRNYAAASSIFSNSVESGRVGGSQSPKLRGVTIRLPSHTSSYSVPCRNEDKALVENSNIGIGNGAADVIGSRASWPDRTTGGRILAKNEKQSIVFAIKPICVRVRFPQTLPERLPTPTTKRTTPIFSVCTLMVSWQAHSA